MEKERKIQLGRGMTAQSYPISGALHISYEGGVYGERMFLLPHEVKKLQAFLNYLAQE